MFTGTSGHRNITSGILVALSALTGSPHADMPQIGHFAYGAIQNKDSLHIKH